jgi:hypothetical protein
MVFIKANHPCASVRTATALELDPPGLWLCCTLGALVFPCFTRASPDVVGATKCGRSNSPPSYPSVRVLLLGALRLKFEEFFLEIA